MADLEGKSGNGLYGASTKRTVVNIVLEVLGVRSLVALIGRADCSNNRSHVAVHS